MNGARGVVIGFNPKRKNYPIVKFVSGVEKTIETAKWTVKSSLGGELVRMQVRTINFSSHRALNYMKFLCRYP